MATEQKQTKKETQIKSTMKTSGSDQNTKRNNKELIERQMMRPIEGYEGLYSITEDGKIYSHRQKKFMKPKPHIQGYYRIGLTKNGKQKFYRIHRLVAETFIENTDNKSEVNHIDGVKNNNHFENLEWVTKSENEKHAYSTGLKKPIFGNAKLTNKQASIIKRSLHFGTKGKDLAEIFGVSNQAVSDIKTNKRWS